MNVLYILIGLLIVCVIFIPKKKYNYYENFNDPNKLNFKNSFKKIPNLIPHLLI